MAGVVRSVEVEGGARMVARGERGVRRAALQEGQGGEELESAPELAAVVVVGVVMVVAESPREGSTCGTVDNCLIPAKNFSIVPRLGAPEVIIAEKIKEAFTMNSPAITANAVVTGAAAAGEMVRGVATAVSKMEPNARRQFS